VPQLTGRQDVDSIADYAFVRALSEGNHGTYHLARTPPRLRLDAEFVVVKVVAGTTTTDTFRRATRELKAFAAVRSPYLVRLFDAGQQGGVFYYAMEYLPLGSLAAPAQPLSRPEVLRAVAHVARAAHALHDAGIVHRDIKPENVLLAEDGGRLSDLGLAQLLQPGVTLTGMGPIGSLEYVDPAVLRGERASRQTDVYSVGMTLHRALTGRSVYGDLPDDQPLLAMRAVLSGTPVIDSSLGPEDRAVIAACISEDAAQRPHSALEVAERVEALPGAVPAVAAGR
jgi:serine/threonine protein kinase